MQHLTSEKKHAVLLVLALLMFSNIAQGSAPTAAKRRNRGRRYSTLGSCNDVMNTAMPGLGSAVNVRGWERPLYQLMSCSCHCACEALHRWS